MVFKRMKSAERRATRNRTDDNRAAQCVGKPVFESFELAQPALIRGKRKTSGMGIYRCDYCRKWHLGAHLQRKNGKSR